MKKIKVEGHKYLVRDSSTGAILNINKTSIQEARSAKDRKKQEQEEFQQMKDDLAEIKTLLRELIKQNG